LYLFFIIVEKIYLVSILMNIAVIGTGYVGLVTGTCLANSGNHVVCVDNDPLKVAKLRNGKIHIYEPGLAEIFQSSVQRGLLHFTEDLKQAVGAADLIFLALPTPPKEDGSADLGYVLSVAEQIAPLLTSYKLIINKSTVPVGTTERIAAAISARTDVAFDVVSNPEFLREGLAVDDFNTPDRIVVGTKSERAKSLLSALYQPFVSEQRPLLFMDERSSEMTKYAANAYLAMRISFMNEMANLSEILGADVEQIKIGMGADHRIGKFFLNPGVGFGGSCFPKDVQALEQTALANGYDFRLLHAVNQVNTYQRSILAKKIIDHFGQNLQGLKVAVWGLAFKPNTDDVREASAAYIIADLQAAGAQIHAYDPEAMDNFAQYLNNTIHFCTDKYHALEGADVLAIVTEWEEFSQVDFEQMHQLMRQKVIFDGRNIFPVDSMQDKGFFYSSIGRKKVGML